ncbi:Hypothetical predicted protein [Octopus vulgaris]|uniref:Uncharacterized protein n=1 Tax=Octopus vulgaris TaxID=6645 RepID=A0AA36BYQ6_OCTVU|nr:Hypothetical predicted protein [Octopus vulgaris]
MFQSAFTRPAAMAVLLLTLTTILVVTSDQELDGYYKRLGTGYSYGYIGTPPTEQFSSTRNLLDCTALAQRSQSQFFTYNKVSHACKNYSPKNIMTVVSTNNKNEISFYRNSKWIKVYAISKGAGSKVYNSFLNIGLPSTWNVDKCNGAFCPNFFRHPFLDFWNNLPIDERFDKLFNTGKCYRSLTRRFYITILGNCEGDRGWLTINEGPHDCQYEKSDHYPIFHYSDTKSKVIWNNEYQITLA